MAAYHLRAKVRSRGKSPISGLKHAAYLTRQAQAEGQVRRAAYGQEHVRYITREGHTRKDYIYHEHGNLPTWAEQNGLKFWASVDKHERMNSVIYREYEVMIPREISPEKWVPLAKEFTKQTLGDRHPYTLAVHCPTGRDGELQPHFHLQYSTRLHDGRERDESHYWKRVNTREPEQGGAPKERSWEKKERLYEVRREWAVLANTYLEREGHEVRIDHRSLKDQTRDLDKTRLTQLTQDTQRALAKIEQELGHERDAVIRTQARAHVREQPTQRQVADHTRATPVVTQEPIRRASRKLEPNLDRSRDDEWLGF